MSTLALDEIATWNADNAAARAAYARHREILDELTVEYPCAKCKRGEHERCNSRSGTAGAHRCLCWEMWHPGHDDNEETAA